AGAWPVAEEHDLARRHLLPALRQYAEVRDRCPLVPEAHVRLAAYAGRFARADRPQDYLARACLLAPADARVWDLAATQALDDGRDAEARDAWRRALRCSHRRLPGLAARLAPRPDA